MSFVTIDLISGIRSLNVGFIFDFGLKNGFDVKKSEICPGWIIDK